MPSDEAQKRQRQPLAQEEFMRRAKPIAHLLGIHHLSASACTITMQVDFIDHEPMEMGVDAAALMVLGLMAAKGAMVHGGQGMLRDGWTDRAILRQKFLLACEAYLAHAAMYHQGAEGRG